MDRKKLSWITWSFIGLTILVLSWMLMNTLHRPERITLPDVDVEPDQIEGELDGEEDALTIVQITPKTVQTAIATLARPEAYRRTVKVEQFWSGGSGSYEITATVSGDWTRMDRTMPDGRVRHSIVGTEMAYVWYNNERAVYSAPAGDISADEEQSVPTYEDILDLPVEEIAVAEYGSLSGLRCIYVESTAASYTMRYWVNVDTGLLVAAEKRLDGETIYRMEALSVDQAEPEASVFRLPDGTQLI